MSRRIPTTISALQAFETAARLNSFTRTAHELNLSQSAVSRQIRGLEQALGIQLFDLVRQRVVLTRAGRQYLDEVRPILQDLQNASMRAMATAQDIEILDIATLPTFCSRWIIPRLGQFYTLHPKLSLHFASRFEPFDFKSEAFDLAIHFGEPNWPDAELHPLFNEHLIAACSPAFKEQFAIESNKDLATVPLLHQSLRSDAWANWFKDIQVEAKDINLGPRFDQFSMLIEATVSGQGAALLPEFFIEEELRTGRLTRIGTRSVESTLGYYVAIPENRRDIERVNAFKGWILDRANAFNENHSAF